MTLSQLQYFMEVGQTLNISQTAKRLFVSQSAVSKQILLLEKELGIPLLKRQNNSLRLTEDGARLLACLQRCKDDFLSTSKHFSVHEYCPDINIGYTASINIGNVLLERALMLNYEQKYQIKVLATQSNTRISSQYDIFITYESRDIPPNMIVIPLYTLHKFIVYSKDDPIAEKPSLTPADFNSKTLFLGNADRTTFQNQLDLCSELGLYPKTCQRDNAISILLSVILEQGFGIMDDLCKEITFPGLAFLPIGSGEHIVLTYKNNAPPSIQNIAKKLAAYLRSYFQQRYGSSDT